MPTTEERTRTVPDDVKAARLDEIIGMLIARDNRLMANDGPAQDTLQGCEDTLRQVYLIATTGSPLEPSSKG